MNNLTSTSSMTPTDIPQLSLRLGSKLRHSHIQEGNDVYFDCSVRSNPWVNEIRWWFEGKEVHTNTSAGIIVSTQSLVLQRVTRSNRGRYTCSATNSEGEGESNSVHLRVQFSPVCKTPQKILYGAARQETVKILCEVEADPEQVNFRLVFFFLVIAIISDGLSSFSLQFNDRWAFNNTSENIVVENHSSESSLSSVATYVPRSELDYGTLFCWGRNSVGTQSEPCVFSVIPAGAPDAVRDCSVTNMTEETLKVECSPGYDGGLQQTFILEVRDSLLQRLRSNVSNSSPSFTARGLTPGTSYVTVVYAANSKGRSKGVVLTAMTTSLPESMNRMAKGEFGFGSLWVCSLSALDIWPGMSENRKWRQRLREDKEHSFMTSSSSSWLSFWWLSLTWLRDGEKPCPSMSQMIIWAHYSNGRHHVSKDEETNDHDLSRFVSLLSCCCSNVFDTAIFLFPSQETCGNCIWVPCWSSWWALSVSLSSELAWSSSSLGLDRGPAESIARPEVSSFSLIVKLLFDFQRHRIQTSIDVLILKDFYIPLELKLFPVKKGWGRSTKGSHVFSKE